MITFKDISHHFTADYILRNINLKVSKGELMVVMGPNGMGKSTLLSVAAGLISPFAGEVRLDGRKRRGSVEEELKIRQNTFYLPDNTWIPNFKTGRQFLLMTGEAYGRDSVEVYEDAARLLKLYELDKVADNPCINYSAGQKKKIGLCSALISKARTLILDEPFSGGLDSSGLQTTKEILKNLATHKDYTVLMAVPVPELVEEVADRIAVIVKGEIVSVGTLQELKLKHNCKGSLAELLEDLIRPESKEELKEYLAGIE
jgi:ABC-type multidrug transport system ATPase subunit